VFEEEMQMYKFSFRITGLLGLVLIATATGCGKQTVIATAPAVVATVPVNGATGVPVSQVITASFNEAMNPATLISATFTLTGPGGSAIAVTISYAAGGVTASLSPTVSLAYGTLYTVWSARSFLYQLL
jgi:hypothetical protein